jgi:hypothetical protein
MTKDVMIALLDQGNNGEEILEILDTILSDQSVDDSDS